MTSGTATPQGGDGTPWLEGAVDLHVHCAPSVFPRWGDGLDVANACAAADMSAVLLKAHEGTTHEMASVLTRTSAPLQVFGGIALNRYVGGLNPDAVEVALRTGARCVWFPTVDAADHVRAFGSTGAYSAQRGAAGGGDGISVLTEDGALVGAGHDILALAAQHDALVATGHLGAAEVEQVVQAAAAAGVEHVLVQHPCFPTPGIDLDAMARLVALGGVLELTYLGVSPMWSMTTVQQAVEVLQRFGGEHVVVSSDAGQPHNPSPPEALRSFVQGLHERGVAEDELRLAVSTTPGRLLGLRT